MIAVVLAAIVGLAAEQAPPPPAKSLPEFSPGVQVFLRGEGRFEPDFGTGNAPDAAAILERARIQLGATWGPLKAFAQAQDARVWGFEASTISNEANTDLHQGYLELFGASQRRGLSGYLRAGRQEVLWGNQRMIGNLAWLPGARSFDAVRALGKASIIELDMFVALLAPRRTVTDNTVDPPATTTSNGAQLVAAKLALDVHEAFNAEAMGLGVLEDARDDDLAFERRIADIGVRAWGEPATGLTYDVEGHAQVGRFSGLRHRAWAWAATVGYLQAGRRLRPGGHVGFAMGSGQACTAVDACAPTESNDVFNFYPTNHIHYGLADLMDWSNMRDLEVAAKLGFDDLLLAVVAYHYFQLQEPAGRWTNAGGALVGAGWDPSNVLRDLGHELDAFVTIKPWKPYLMVQPGYAFFLPVAAGQRLGGDAPQHFAYLWLVGTFG